MADGPFDPETGELISRAPEKRDLVDLCRQLQDRGCLFLVVGGFAAIFHGLPRTTGDVDILIDTSLENEALAYDALATLPDGCVRELDPGDVAKFNVVRVADEILVDLMGTASGITYAEAAPHIEYREIDGVRIPFANAELLYRMKVRAGREKDRGDIYFLEKLLTAQGKPLPAP
jgi:predicted nucleotidyltransferase